MNLSKPALGTIVFIAMALPAASFANSIWHTANNEKGFTYHPEHFVSATTRAQVQHEIGVSRRDGSFDYLQRGLPVPVKDVAPGKTREAVQKEVLNLTVQQRREIGMLDRR